MRIMFDAPRKRGRGHPSNADTTSVNLMDALDDPLDPDFLELLKEYDEDGEDELDEKQRILDKQRHDKPPYLTQGTIYLSMLVAVVLFIWLINFFNMRQLERLKEEYGMDEKKVVPEIWWRKALIYHIFVRSFKDSDGNGIGDLNGVRESIHHLDYVGATAVLLSAFYPSPGVHYGKDVTDFKAVDRNCGTMEDFTKLVEELHAMGIKVMIEVTPNHTSKRHRWFVESRRGGTNNKYKNYYVWDSGQTLLNGTVARPNNWLSRYGGPAWTFDEEKMQYYYHHYHYSMPDLNHRDAHVREELLQIFEFWLEKGIDGILIDGTHVMFESDDVLLDESLSEKPGVRPDEYEFIDHIYTEDHPDVHEFLSGWREHIENFAVKSNRKIGLLVDVIDNDIKDVMKYYHTGADVPVCHSLISLREMECDARCIHDLVEDWIAQVPDDKDPLWMLSSPFYQRMRRGGTMKYQPLMNMLIMLLPGAAITFYGEELGMPGQTGEKRRSFVGGLPYNFKWPITPMQWTGDPGAGFTAGEPWINPHSSYKTINAENQKVILELPKYSPSPLQQFQKLARIRQQTSFIHGKLQYSVISSNIFSFMRYAKDSAPYIVAMNFGNATETNDFSMSTGVQYGKAVVHVTGDTDPGGHIVDGGKVNLEKLTLDPGEGVVALLLMDLEFSL